MTFLEEGDVEMKTEDDEDLSKKTDKIKTEPEPDIDWLDLLKKVRIKVYSSGFSCEKIIC